MIKDNFWRSLWPSVLVATALLLGRFRFAQGCSSSPQVIEKEGKIVYQRDKYYEYLQSLPWKNSGEASWPGKLCKKGAGKRQSPIDINVRETTMDFERNFIKFGPLVFRGYDNQKIPVKAFNNGHTLQFISQGIQGRHPTVQGGPLYSEYRLEQVHFHWPSEHSINGQKGGKRTRWRDFYKFMFEWQKIAKDRDVWMNKGEAFAHQFPMEVHFVHIRSDLNVETAIEQWDGLAILAVFWNIQAMVPARPVMRQNDFQYFAQLVVPGSTLDNVAMDVGDLLSPNRRHYFTYAGSLSSPECNECVIWILFEEPLMVPEINYRMFGNLGVQSNNFRSIQQVVNHKVYRTVYRGIIMTPLIQETFQDFTTIIKNYVKNLTLQSKALSGRIAKAAEYTVYKFKPFVKKGSPKNVTFNIPPQTDIVKEAEDNDPTKVDKESTGASGGVAGDENADKINDQPPVASPGTGNNDDPDKINQESQDITPKDTDAKPGKPDAESQDTDIVKEAEDNDPTKVDKESTGTSGGVAGDENTNKINDQPPVASPGTGNNDDPDKINQKSQDVKPKDTDAKQEKPDAESQDTDGKPKVPNANPEELNSKPGEPSDKPDTNANPEEPNVNPEEPNANPEEPNDKPEDANANPEETNGKPDTNANPEEPNVNPEETNANPEEPNDKPEDANANPEETNANPEEPSEKPGDTNANPEEPNANPEETNGKPQKPNSNPKGPNANPEEPDANPEEINGKPGDTNANPEEPNANPEETNGKPQETNANPKVPNANPEEPNANPQETNANPKETNGKPQEPNANPEEPNASLEKPTGKPGDTNAKPEVTNANPEEPNAKPDTNDIPEEPNAKPDTNANPEEPNANPEETNANPEKPNAKPDTNANPEYTDVKPGDGNDDSADKINEETLDTKPGDGEEQTPDAKPAAKKDDDADKIKEESPDTKPGDGKNYNADIIKEEMPGTKPGDEEKETSHAKLVDRKDNDADKIKEEIPNAKPSDGGGNDNTNNKKETQNSQSGVVANDNADKIKEDLRKGQKGNASRIATYNNMRKSLKIKSKSSKRAEAAINKVLQESKKKVSATQNAWITEWKHENQGSSASDENLTYAKQSPAKDEYTDKITQTSQDVKLDDTEDDEDNTNEVSKEALRNKNKEHLRKSQGDASRVAAYNIIRKSQKIKPKRNKGVETAINKELRKSNKKLSATKNAWITEWTHENQEYSASDENLDSDFFDETSFR